LPGRARAARVRIRPMTFMAGYVVGAAMALLVCYLVTR
jgi:hypothetical protein